MDIKKMLTDGIARYVVRRESVARQPRPASKHGLAKRKPKGWRQARKKARKQARAMRRRNK